MNILDESTKTMLDAGKVAVLDGGYIVITPETLFQVVQGATLETLGDIMMEQPAEEEANDSSICSMCGTKDTEGTHELVLVAGYGSVHDMERVRVPLCADCCDRLFSELVQLPGAVIESPW